MPLEISFSQFDAISSGTYNAGQIDYKGEGADASLKKVNAHVHFTGKNNVVVDTGHTVEIKRAFVKAMSTRLNGDANALAAIRKSLGLPPDDSNPKALNQRTIEPLTRQEVRAIIDKYVNGGNAGAVDADVAARRDEVNAANQRALPIRIGTQTLYLDSMVEELSRAGTGEPKKSQAMSVLETLMRPDGKMDAVKFARSMNVFAFMAEQAAANDQDGGKDAWARLSAAFARALDTLDNGSLSQVYQSLISRETEALKGELSRRLDKFDLSASQADVCERTALAMGRLESLVLSEISYRTALGNATTEQERAELAAEAPVYRHCGMDIQRDLSLRNNDREMTSVNLQILTTRAAYGDIQEKNLASKVTGNLVKLGFTEADAHDIGDAMRKSELTVNAHLSNLLGWRKGQDPKNPPLFQPGYSLVNTFVSKEQKGMPKDATGYLVRRDKIEKHFFPEYGKMSEFQGKDRPIYAAFNTAGSTAGAAPSYGGVVFVMKEHVKQQATYTLNDTFFAIKFDFNTESKAKFLAKAQEYFSKFVKPEALAQLADESTQVGMWVSEFFKVQENTGIATGKGLETMDRLKWVVDFLAKNSIEGARTLDADDMMAVLFDAIGVKDSESARVAGYDHIENLLADMKELDPLVMGLSTARRMANPDAPMRFAGGDYIEAQLHGPIVITRDVEEMRVPRGEIEAHYMDLSRENPSIMDGMDKKEWIAQQVQADVERLVQFGKDNGFKVTVYEFDDGNHAVATFNLVEDMTKVKAMMRDEHSAFVRDLADNHVGELMKEALTQIPFEKSEIVENLFGKGLDAAPQWLFDAAKTAAAKTKAIVDDVQSYEGYQTDDLRKSALGFVSAVLEGVVDSVSAAHALGVDDNAKILVFVKEALEAGTDSPKLMNYVSAKIALERIVANPQAVIEETLAKELAGRKEDIDAIGFPGGFKIGGAALNRILAKVQEHLAKFQRSRASLEKCNALINEIREKVIAREIASRLDLLKSIDMGSFPDENIKKSYFGWVMNAGRIKSAEELKGVKGAAEGLYDAVSNLLSQKIDFKAPAFMALLQDVVRRINEASVADSAANYQGDHKAFGTDDRNGYITRAVSVGLGAVEARMGRPALEKLARILAKPEFTGVSSALANALSPRAKIDAEGSSNISCFYTAHFAFLERLKNKYGLATGPMEKDFNDYSQVPPNVRGLISLAAPDYIAELDAKVPYAPQTTKTMPAALNPDGAPKTLAERKRALFGALPAYGNHEKSFEKGRNIHGRGHATRVFIFANALGNIMRERGVNVDMGALSITAAGHDMGRKGGGTDVWEKESGELVAQLAETVYPGAYGEDWKAQANLNVSAGHGAAADAQRSVEGLLMKAADSLDYTRVAPLELKRFHFLEKSLNVGGVNVMQDDNLRRALMHEAELLTKATSPLAEKREEIIRLKMGENREDRLQGEALETEVTDAEIAIAQLTDEQIVERIEKEIRDNPAKYPLLTKYYLNAE